MLDVFCYLDICVFLVKKDLCLLLSTDSGFSAMINARLALGYWSHIEGMSLL